jgi:hypothetical protein
MQSHRCDQPHKGCHFEWDEYPVQGLIDWMLMRHPVERHIFFMLSLQVFHDLTQ